MSLKFWWANVHFLCIAILFSPNIFGQDSPETAITTIQTWSLPGYTCATFENMTDSPESIAIGPDFWFEVVALTNTINIVIVPYTQPFGIIVNEVFDSGFQTIPSYSGDDGQLLWAVDVGSTYYISFTWTQLESDFLGYHGYAVSHTGGIINGDVDGNGSANSDDIPAFLAQLGQEGPNVADYSQDFHVNMIDLLMFLPNVFVYDPYYVCE